MFWRHTRWAWAWALLILVLCLLPGGQLPQWSWADLLSLDKPVHAFLFFVLVVLTTRGLQRQTRFQLGRRALLAWAFGIAVVYGGLTELMQGFLLVDRTADLLDFIANTAGAIAALVYLVRSKPRPVVA